MEETSWYTHSIEEIKNNETFVQNKSCHCLQKEDGLCSGSPEWKTGTFI